VQPQLAANPAEQIWDVVLEQLRQEVDIPPLTWGTWFGHTAAVAIMEDTLLVEVGQDYVRNKLRDDWQPTLEQILRTVAPELHLVFVLENERAQFTPKPRVQSETGLVPQFSFENFIVGDSNRLAFAAACAVADTPARVYNPLFLYGGTGLGKTHLMHAIGNVLLARNPGLRVLYVSSERFTNELIAAIQSGKSHEFRTKYRNVDVLLIDDIQQIAGRESTQNEFFHTFNELRNFDKQIILSSDRPPKDIQKLEERLRSRFENGLQADIQPPDLDTRIAILSTKAEGETITIVPEALKYMAEMAKSNVRELEGTFTRVCAYARLTERPVDLPLAREALRSINPLRSDVKVNPSQVLNAVCDTQGVPVEMLKSPLRSARAVLVRQMAMLLLRELTTLSLPRIGDELGGRDHTTVMHGLEKMEKMVAENLELRHEVQRVRNRILEMEGL